MSAIDAIYSQTVTMFNRFPAKNGESPIWLPTIIDGVHLIVSKSSVWSGQGEKSSDDVKLNIRYMPHGSDVLIPCKVAPGGTETVYKKWYEPKAWRKNPNPSDSITFSFGNSDDFDFFIEGVFDELTAPISDESFGCKGFYGYMNSMYDNVFVISSVSKYNLIPHFEITAR